MISDYGNGTLIFTNCTVTTQIQGHDSIAFFGEAYYGSDKMDGAFISITASRFAGSITAGANFQCGVLFAYVVNTSSCTVSNVNITTSQNFGTASMYYYPETICGYAGTL